MRRRHWLYIGVLLLFGCVGGLVLAQEEFAAEKTHLVGAPHS